MTTQNTFCSRHICFSLIFVRKIILNSDLYLHNRNSKLKFVNVLFSSVCVQYQSIRCFSVEFFHTTTVTLINAVIFAIDVLLLRWILGAFNDNMSINPTMTVANYALKIFFLNISLHFLIEIRKKNKIELKKKNTITNTNIRIKWMFAARRREKVISFKQILRLRSECHCFKFTTFLGSFDRWFRNKKLIIVFIFVYRHN